MRCRNNRRPKIRTSRTTREIADWLVAFWKWASCPSWASSDRRAKCWRSAWRRGRLGGKGVYIRRRNFCRNFMALMGKRTTTVLFCSQTSKISIQNPYKSNNLKLETNRSTCSRTGVPKPKRTLSSSTQSRLGTPRTSKPLKPTTRASSPLSTSNQSPTMRAAAAASSSILVHQTPRTPSRTISSAGRVSRAKASLGMQMTPMTLHSRSQRFRRLIRFQRVPLWRRRARALGKIP